MCPQALHELAGHEQTWTWASAQEIVLAVCAEIHQRCGTQPENMCSNQVRWLSLACPRLSLKRKTLGGEARTCLRSSKLTVLQMPASHQACLRDATLCFPHWIHSRAGAAPFAKYGRTTMGSKVPASAPSSLPLSPSRPEVGSSLTRTVGFQVP